MDIDMSGVHFKMRKRRKDAIHYDRDTQMQCWNEQKNKERSEKLMTEPHQFIGVDGEGETDENGVHKYVMLSVGNDTLHDNGNELTFESIMGFLWEIGNLPENRDVVFVGFFLAYDFTMWLKSLPYDRAKMIYRAKDIARRQRKSKGSMHTPPFPVYYGEWEFDLLNDHRFKLRKIGSDAKWLWICDAGPFFQSSFLAAIDPAKWADPVLSDDEFKIIQAGKADRNAAKFGPVMARYNTLENEILARVMVEYDKGLLHMGIRLRRNQYFGPGQVASAWLKLIGAPTREWLEQNVHAKILEAAQKSYYGGWFEIFMHGHIPGTVYEYDINSAYPTIIKILPCLKCGKWTPDMVDTDATLNLVLATCSQDVTNNAPIGAMPHRTGTGTILRPRNTMGWYWLHEIQASQKAGLIDHYKIHKSWSYKTDCSHKPFAAIEDLYQERIHVGKDTAVGKAYKLCYNSVYGKLAQSIGNPVYANPIYASLVTAGCRTMILDAIATHPNGLRDVTMVATDGVYFRTPHPSLDIGDGLGQWGTGTKSNLTQHQPGLYWDDAARGTSTPKFKSRGISPSDMREAVPDLDEQWRVQVDWIKGGNHVFNEENIRKYDFTRVGVFQRLMARPRGSRSKKSADSAALEVYNAWRTRWPRVDIPLKFALVGARIAMHRNNWGMAGVIEKDAFRKISSTPVEKRDIDTAYVEDGVIKTMPYVQSKSLVSTGYSKKFGLDLRNQMLQQNGVFTRDGTFRDEMYDQLKVDNNAD